MLRIWWKGYIEDRPIICCKRGKLRARFWPQFYFTIIRSWDKLLTIRLEWMRWRNRTLQSIHVMSFCSVGRIEWLKIEPALIPFTPFSSLESSQRRIVESPELEWIQYISLVPCCEKIGCRTPPTWIYLRINKNEHSNFFRVAFQSLHFCGFYFIGFFFCFSWLIRF